MLVQKKYILGGGGSNTNYKIAAIDFGIKHNILNQLSKNKCNIKIFPANVTSNEIMNYNPDGIFLSNGPGDPSAVKYAIKTVKKLIGKKPIFGICLGHQILALAMGGKTYKLKFGHRGCNHPVLNIHSRKTEITSQNHGISVDANITSLLSVVPATTTGVTLITFLCDIRLVASFTVNSLNPLSPVAILASCPKDWLSVNGLVYCYFFFSLSFASFFFSSISKRACLYPSN